MSGNEYDLTTKQGYLDFHAACCDKMKAITANKNADYTGGSTDPFANFQAVQALDVATVEQGFMVRMLDKFMRINSLASGQRTAKVKDEAIEDTLLDLANYAILLAAYLRRRGHSKVTIEKAMVECGAVSPSKTSYAVYFAKVSPLGLIREFVTEEEARLFIAHRAADRGTPESSYIIVSRSV